MRIAMVSAHYELLDGRIFYHEARAAVAAGHEVVLVHWDRKGGGDREEKTVDGVRTISLPIPIRGNLLSKAVRFRGIRKTLAEEVVRQRPDLVHCHDLETLPIGVDVKQELGVPLLYDAHEDYPAMVAMTNRVAARAFARLESRLLARVDRVVTVNEILREKYAKRQPTTVVANYPQRSLSEPRPTPRDRALAGKIVVVYVGGISRTRGLVELLDAVKRVGSSLPMHVLVVGKALDTLDCVEEARARGLGGAVTVRPWVPVTEIPAILASGDIGYAVYNPTRSNAQASPVKMFEYMAAGLPVLANEGFPVPDAVVGKWRCGLLVPCEPAAIAKALHQLAADADLRREMGERGREAVRKEYNWEGQARNLLAAYAALAKA